MGNHYLGWNQSILILVQNHQLLIITSRMSQPRSPLLILDLRKCLLNLEFQKMSFFTFSLDWKVYFLPWATGSVKSSSTDYNKSNKPNPKSPAHIGSEKSLVELRVPKKWAFSLFSHFLLYWKVYFFTLNHDFLKRITTVLFRLSIYFQLSRQSFWFIRLLSGYLYCLFCFLDSLSSTLHYLTCYFDRLSRQLSFNLFKLIILKNYYKYNLFE